MSIADDILMHYGIGAKDNPPGRGSGRYPLGFGSNPYQRPKDFRERVEKLKKEGMTTGQIVEALGLRSSVELRAQLSMARTEERNALLSKAKELRAQGMSNPAIAKELGMKGESSVRALFDEDAERRSNQARVTADYLKEIVDKKGMIDVGEGVEADLHVSKEKLNEALFILEAEGYNVYGGRVPQDMGGERFTTQRVLATPDKQHKDIYDFENVSTVKDYDKILTEDGTVVRPAFRYPESMDSSRLKIRYAEEGGIDKDGVIELRRGVPDLDLGDAHYAQVRILVDGTHYLKGMALYSDDMPDGVDVVFNTNKREGTPALGPKDNTVLKRIGKDPENPFGSLIKEHGGQYYYEGEDGKEHLGLINKRSEEGDWGEWSKGLPSQFLSKQPMELINRQLNLAKLDKQQEFEEICALTNPEVKKNLLSSFADDCDAASVHLKAAALPNESYKVILPLTSIKDTEVYAPHLENGSEVALVRFPHAGQFEIPILTVNNKLKEGKDILGSQPKDAVGVSKKTADQLSGADFDGDTVMCIPITDKVKIKTRPPLEGLKDFDAKLEYGGKPEGTYIRMSKDNTQLEMGKVSNLITDMTLKGASYEEIAKAVRHSMVVIDAEKHGLDYKQSEIDNDIPALRKKYMGHTTPDGKESTGASTLISAAKSEASAPKTKGQPRINQEGKDWYDPTRPEGALVYKLDPDRFYTDKTGKVKERTRRSTKMAETDDPYTLVSEHRTAEELAYAAYAKEMKDLANRARLEMANTKSTTYSASAKAAYKDEVDHLNAQVTLAKLNKPKERQAQRIASSYVEARKKAYEESGATKKEIKDDLKKERQRALTAARVKVGAKSVKIKISDREWEAIQAGAFASSRLSEILSFADSDRVRELATPRAATQLSAARIAKIKQMAAGGYTTADIAKSVGCSASTVTKYL